jgi:hypothetical protein
VRLFQPAVIPHSVETLGFLLRVHGCALAKHYNPTEDPSGCQETSLDGTGITHRLIWVLPQWPGTDLKTVSSKSATVPYQVCPHLDKMTSPKNQLVNTFYSNCSCRVLFSSTKKADLYHRWRKRRMRRRGKKGRRSRRRGRGGKR